jgi:hypothetical protein
MSGALAIAGVTAVLRDLLNDGMINHNISGILGSTVTVSAKPPDRLISTDGTEISQLNLFLHSVTPNPGWQNMDLPSRDSTGRHRLTNPPLALDLHYLLIAYGSEALHTDILLGYAMQLLHETPVLNRSAIRTALQPSPEVGTALPSALQALADCGLADQVEQIKITPEYLSTEEMSKLWTAIQSHYRPSTAYMATVVLIESTRPAMAPLPVLSRGRVDPVTQQDQGVAVLASLLPPLPTINSVAPTNGQPAATVGAVLEFGGHHLNGTDRVAVFTNSRFNIEQEVAAEPGDSATSSQVVVPNLPVGVYQVALRLVQPDETEPRTSNHLAITLGPEITTPLPATFGRDGEGAATIDLACQPEVRPGQLVSLLLGTAETTAQPRVSGTDTITFIVQQAPLGEHYARLRVDGIDSPLIDRQASPPTFLDYRIIIT